MVNDESGVCRTNVKTRICRDEEGKRNAVMCARNNTFIWGMWLNWMTTDSSSTYYLLCSHWCATTDRMVVSRAWRTSLIYLWGCLDNYPSHQGPWQPLLWRATAHGCWSSCQRGHNLCICTGKGATTGGWGIGTVLSNQQNIDTLLAIIRVAKQTFCHAELVPLSGNIAEDTATKWTRVWAYVLWLMVSKEYQYNLWITCAWDIEMSEGHSSAPSDTCTEINWDSEDIYQRSSDTQMYSQEGMENVISGYLI